MLLQEKTRKEKIKSYCLKVILSFRIFFLPCMRVKENLTGGIIWNQFVKCQIRPKIIPNNSKLIFIL